MRHDPALAARILLVDGDPVLRRALQDLLSGAGHVVAHAASAAEARRLAAREEPALIILEVVLPDGDGISLLAELRALWPGLPALVVTRYVEPRSIVEAMRSGASDYLAKPVDPEELLSACRAALAERPPTAPPRAAAPPPLVGASAASARLRETIQRLARGRLSSILIRGEDGVGKTWAAQALHGASARRSAPCLVLDAATSFDPAVALFGRSGARGLRPAPGGLLAAAHGGTMIIDDVDRLAPEVQRRLLDWASGVPAPTVCLVGLTTSAERATPLLGWLGRVVVEIEPLRDRPADILPLAEHVLTETGAGSGQRPAGFTAAAREHLVRYGWPGNVAELRATLERAARAAAWGPIQPEHLAAGLTSGPLPAWMPTGEPRPLREMIDAYIDHVLTTTGGNRSRAARLLGIARETLRTRMLGRHVAP